MPRTQEESAQSVEARDSGATSTATGSATAADDSRVQPSQPSPDSANPLAGLPNDGSAVCVEVPLEVHGSRRSNVQGQPAEPFHEETFSVIVFPHGGILRLEAAVIVGQMLAITNKNSQRGILCRVTNVRNYPKLKSYVEIVFSQAAPGFWGVRFPDEGGTPTNHSPMDHAVAVQPPVLEPQQPAPTSRAPEPAVKSAAKPSTVTTQIQSAAPAAPAIKESRSVVPSSHAAPPLKQRQATQAQEDSSDASIELLDDSSEMSSLVEALQDATDAIQEFPQQTDLPRQSEKQELNVPSVAASPRVPAPAAPAHSKIDAHKSEPIKAETAKPGAFRVEAAPSDAASPLKSDDFWSTSFPEEILNWALESAAIPAVESQPAQKHPPEQPVIDVRPSAKIPTEAAPAKPAPTSVPKSTAVASAPAVKEPPKQSPAPATEAVAPATSPAAPAAPKSAAPAQPAAVRTPRPPTAAAPKSVDSKPLAAKRPEKLDPSAQPNEETKPEGALGDLQSSMMKELERLALSHMDDDSEDASGEAVLTFDDEESDCQAPSHAPRLSRAEKKSFAAKGRTKFRDSAPAAQRRSARSEDDDTIVVNSNTAILLKPMNDGSLPLAPLLGATQEFDASSVGPLTMGTSSRANLLVAAVGVIMLVVVGAGWYFFHNSSASAPASTAPAASAVPAASASHPLPEPTGTADASSGNSTPGNSAQPNAPVSHPDPMDAAAAAALKAGAATSNSNGAASGSNSVPASSKPAGSSPSSYQPAGSRPLLSQPLSQPVSQPLARSTSSQPAASPPASNSFEAARSRATPPSHEASAPRNDVSTDSDSDSRRLLMPPVKLVAPASAAHARPSSSDAVAPTIAAGNSAAPAPKGVNTILPNSEANMPAPAAPLRSTPNTVGGRVREPQLITKVTPVYPAEARQFNVQGDVTIDATIDARGNVSGMRVISGPAVLQRAAMDALREWKYEPSTLNDRPVSIHTIVTIRFTR